MEIIKFENNTIKEKVYSLLNKKENENLTLEEMKKVKSILLNENNIDNSKNIYTFSDFNNLRYLEEITLNKFNIDDECINKINSLKGLKTIIFNNCLWNNTTKIKLDIQSVIITNSKFPDMLLENYKEILKATLIGIKELDLNYISDMIDIEELCIYNSNIKNANKLLDFTKLKTLKLDGSKLDNEKILDVISLNKDFSFNEIFFYCD